MTTPALDGRDAAAVEAELDAIRPGYTPDWTPQPDGPGHALLRILARYAELVIQGLDQAPGKGFLAFLEAMGISLLPPRAARVPLVFRVADQSPVDPQLPRGSEVAVALAPAIPPPGQPAPPSPVGPVVFSTTQTVALTRARLAAVQSRIPAGDRWADHSASATTSFRLFDDLEAVPHHLYLAHDTLLALADEAVVGLQVSLGSLGPTSVTRPRRGTPGVADPAHLDLAWEYLTEDGWLALDPVEDLTRDLTVAGEVKLHKSCGPDAASGTVNGIESFWVRARTTGPLPLTGGDESHLPVLASIRGQVSFRRSGLPLDEALGDGVALDTSLDTSKDFLPFGAQPVLGATFLLACDDAFSRVGARIELDLELRTPGKTPSNGDVQVIWEYTAGRIWRQLTPGDAEFDDQTNGLRAKPDRAQGRPAISFVRPPDWEEVTVNGASHHWLRARILSGDYGGPTTFTVVNGAVQPHNQPVPPMIQSISVAYDYRTAPFVPHHCLTLNGFAFDDVTEANRWGRPPFQPFRPLGERLPAVHLGFDRRLPVGLISLLAATPESDEAEPTPAQPALTWEYRAPQGWNQLEVLDGTAGFQRSGLIQFIGPADHAAEPGPAGPLFWVRALFQEGVAPEPLALDALWPNGVWAEQRTSVQGEALGRSDGSERLGFRLQRPPVLEGQRVEVQEWHGSGREWESLFPDVAPAAMRLDRDARGQVSAVWVTWEERPHLLGSRAADRHYVLERAQGLVQFGDGVRGMVPPPGAVVAASYDRSDGPAGNVAGGAVTTLQSPVPYVEGVTNPLPAAGGALAETLARTGARGPQHLRSRGRTLTAADYEWLALEASTEVAFARCLAVTGRHGRPQPGWITLVVVPRTDQPRPRPSQQLLRAVQDHVRARAPAAVAGQIRVVGPDYLAVSVLAEVAVADPDQAARVEAGLRVALDSFLHPLIGGPAGEGWIFGQAVYLSQVAEVVRGVPGVDSAERLQLAVDGLLVGDRVPVGPDRLPTPGLHTIKLTLRG